MADKSGIVWTDKVTWCFFGREQDVLVAEYVYDVMRAACAAALAQFRQTELYRRRRTAKTRAAAVRAFQEGLADALVRKLRLGLWRRYGGGDRGWALIRATGAELDAVRDRRGKNFRDSRPIAQAKGRFKDDGKIAGQRAGAEIDVVAGVAGGVPVRGLLR